MFGFSSISGMSISGFNFVNNLPIWVEFSTDQTPFWVEVIT